LRLIIILFFIKRNKSLALTHSRFSELKQLAAELKEQYQNGNPFPNIVIDDFFDEAILSRVLTEFPDLSTKNDVHKFDGYNEKKLAAIGETHFGDTTKLLSHYLNSQPFLEFLQELTGIKEVLMPDPYFDGGGYHEIKPGGYLKVHADFNKHQPTNLDRRINVLVYLNKDWEESYGGHFELWNEDMTNASKKILPLFNRVAIFSTTSISYHGHPDPLTCPADRSRKSLAYYYYSNGRPESELPKDDHLTLFVSRAGVRDDTKDPKFRSFTSRLKTGARLITPPIIFNSIRRIFR
jgi:Rps23 Pro-64 3,4-dihydroxylase Tpa1-like proline 4-hydroxylase